MIARRSVFIALLVGAGAVGSSLVATPAAAVAPGPVQLIDLDLGDEFFIGGDASSNGHFALVRTATGSRLSDLRTGSTVASDDDFPAFGVPTDDGQKLFYERDGGLFVREVGTGAIDELVTGLTGDWAVDAVLAADADGSSVVFRAANGALGAARSFLLDTAGPTLVTPEAEGLSGDGSDTFHESISADGALLRFRVDPTGQASFTQLWNRTSGQRTSRDAAVEFDTTTGQWRTSDDLGWEAFFGRPAGAAADSPLQLMRGPLGQPGSAEVITAAETVESFDVTDDGVVVFVDGSKLFAFPGDNGAPVELSLSADGSTADAPVEPQFQVVRDGSSVLFTSFASNLAGGSTDDRKLFTVELDAPPTFTLPTDAGASRLINTRDSTPVPPSSSRCVAAEGASPGDFVVVNVTPVDAGAPGFGVLHSSDDEAGATSNVNFGPGTVDPNVAFVKVGADGEICFTNSEHGPVNVIIDQLITVAEGTLRLPGASGAERLINTRNSRPVPSSGKVCTIAIGARIGDFVAVNVTPVDATALGFGVLHSSDDVAGPTSNVNFGPGTVDPNVAIAQVGSDGNICFTNSVHGPVNVIIDALVIAPEDTFSVPGNFGAERLVNTRDSSPVGASATLCVAAASASAGDYVVLNVTPVDATALGFGVLHSSDDVAGPTSNVNFGPGSTDPNVAMVQVGSDGEVCFTNSVHGPVDVIIDQLVTAPT